MTTRHFRLKKDMMMGLTFEGKPSCVRRICPEYHYWVDLDEDGRIYLVVDLGKKRIPLVMTEEMREPACMEEVKMKKLT